MNILLGFFVFIFGAIIGSFLNVVSLRFNTGKDFYTPSSCQSCGVRLRWYELLPILSFLFQKGRCRSCNSSVSLQYPLVEGVTGLIFLALFLTPMSLYDALILAVITSLLIVIAVYDIRHSIVPNTLVYMFILISFLLLFFDTSLVTFSYPSFSAFIAGPVLALPIWLLWHVSSGRWIGLGDAKLFLGVGWFLGLYEGISAFIISFWIGAAFGILLIFARYISRTTQLNLGTKPLTIKNEIPFAPFIIASFLIVALYNINIITFLLI